MIKTQTLKGFRDFLPQESKKRQYVIEKLRTVFELHGFEPLETPTLEYEEVLMGKYGDEGEKLLYRFEDQGKRRVAMRYDQTVPLARVVAQYQHEIPLPFKRYQIQPVWRAENTQKGRYREFIQCDIDSVGVGSVLSDVEIIATTLASYQSLGFTNITVLLNDRATFEDLPIRAIITIDKLEKIGEEGVCKELVSYQIVPTIDEAKKLLQSIIDTKPTKRLQEIMSLLGIFGVNKSNIKFTPTLARGLDYYTGVIIEVVTPEYPVGSLGGGGRFDKLLHLFTEKDLPAVGFSFGFDRTIEAMEAVHLFPDHLRTTQVLVTVFSEELEKRSIEVTSFLRTQHINTEVYLDSHTKMEKQLKYADQKGIPYVVIIGPEEAAKHIVTLKNLETREQKQVSQVDLPHEII